MTGIHLTSDRLGRPSGRAFIEMEHEEDVNKALEKHRQYLGPRYVEGSAFFSYTSLVQKKSSSQVNLPVSARNCCGSVILLASDSCERTSGLY